MADADFTMTKNRKVRLMRMLFEEKALPDFPLISIIFHMRTDVRYTKNRDPKML
jgi:hypothetical protein